MAIIDFRLSCTFLFRPVLHSFPTELPNLQLKINILRNRFLFCTEKADIFEVILSICSAFYQIGTPHFSLEGVVVNISFFILSHDLETLLTFLTQEHLNLQGTEFHLVATLSYSDCCF